MKSLMRVIITSIALFALWFLLSGKTEFNYLAMGAATSIAIAFMVSPLGKVVPFSITRFLLYLPWLVIEVLKADIAVAKIVLRKDMNIEPVFVKQHTAIKNHKQLTLLGCSITLTPGTLSVYVNEEYILVHALDDKSFAQDIREQIIEKKIIKAMKVDTSESGEAQG